MDNLKLSISSDLLWWITESYEKLPEVSFRKLRKGTKNCSKFANSYKIYGKLPTLTKTYVFIFSKNYVCISKGFMTKVRTYEKYCMFRKVMASYGQVLEVWHRKFELSIMTLCEASTSTSYCVPFKSRHMAPSKYTLGHALISIRFCNDRLTHDCISLPSCFMLFGRSFASVSCCSMNWPVVCFNCSCQVSCASATRIASTLWMRRSHRISCSTTWSTHDGRKAWGDSRHFVPGTNECG